MAGALDTHPGDGPLNESALKRIGWIIQKMHTSGKGAPVFDAEARTHGNPFRILVFTMLSARTRDDTTIRALGRLFAEADTPEGIVSLGRKRLEELLYGVGFYRVKARHLLDSCRILSRKKRVPDTLEEMLELPGVGRKTANIVLARAFGHSSLGVDVHVHRISNRLGLVRTKKPNETEKALLKIIPQENLRELNRNFVAFGQTVCLPRKPKCGACPLNQLCYRVNVKEKCEKCRYGP